MVDCTVVAPALFDAQVLLVQLAAKKAGYADVVYLDAKTDTYLEEVSSCNIFVVKGRTIKTPPLTVRKGDSGVYGRVLKQLVEWSGAHGSGCWCM